MESTVSLLAKVLGAKGVESSASDTRFVADSSIDVAPVTKVKEDPATPGRVSLHVGRTLVHIDSQPSIAIEIETLEDG
jgi:hypothetical protein